jgi:hypothetical protein
VNRDIKAVIGQEAYYKQIGGLRSFKNKEGQDVSAYLIEIVNAKKNQGDFALIQSTKHPDNQASGDQDQYITHITYGKQCDLLKILNNSDDVTLSTRTFDGTNPVDDKQGKKKPNETINNDKQWKLSENKEEWKELGASIPSDVINASCIQI